MIDRSRTLGKISDEEASLSGEHTNPRPLIVVAICTFHRNGPLRLLLDALARIADRERDTMAIGVAVVDDSADRQAQPVTVDFVERFEHGLTYRHSGKRNIAAARNLALETALEMGAQWIAMTDDDCEPAENWLNELLQVQRKFDADVVTGPLRRRAPDHAPLWLRSQPFLNVTAFQAETGASMQTAFTNNSMISAEVLRQDPQLRFDLAFGRIGGEDMVFYRAIAKSGHRIVFAADALVFENEEDERLTFSYQMRRHFWVGNSSVRTSLKNGASKSRMAVHGLAGLPRALRRPITRMIGGERPQFLYCLAQIMESCGKLAGAAGMEVKHK
ncbi:MAG: glycosyltransferase [Pontixanthobacter sp.]